MDFSVRFEPFHAEGARRLQVEPWTTNGHHFGFGNFVVFWW
jgi:hypothetical protein